MPIFLSWRSLSYLEGEPDPRYIYNFFKFIWGLVWVKIMSPVNFDLPAGNIKKKKMILGKRLISPTNPNKCQLTFNFQGNFLSSGMLINCISESKEMLFNQFLLSWRCSMLLKSKCNKLLHWKRLKQSKKNDIYTIYL